MGLLARLFDGGLRAATPGPTDDWWYQPVGTMTPSGMRVDVDQAQKISAWYRGRDILATVLAMNRARSRDSVTICNAVARHQALQ